MRKTINKIDKPLLILTIICLIFGLLMVGSASSLKAYMLRNDNYYYFKKQLEFILIGSALGLAIINIPIKTYRKLIAIPVAAVIMGLIYVLFKGKISNGVTGWLFVGGYGVQPSEFAKTILIVYFAVIFEKMMRIKYVSNFSKLLPFVIPFIIMALIFKQPDFGTMVIIFGITFITFLLVPYDRKFKFVAVVFLVIAMLVTVIVLMATGKGLTDSQKSRFNFTKPCTRYRERTGYQACNGYIAINSGGVTGVGFGNSKQKYLYLPEAYTDFIFAIIMEEWGYLMGVAIMAVYFIIIYRIIRIGKKSYNIQGMIICYDVAAYIMLHIFINLGGVLGLIPLTGVPLPFYSYGGSFMINLIVALALVQRVSVENKIFEQKHLVN